MIKKFFSPLKIILGIALLGLLIIIGIIFSDVFGVAQSSDTIQIEITENDNLTLISKKLQEEDVILNASVFKLFYKFTGYSEIIHPGTIQVSHNNSYREIAKAINEPINHNLKITIPEGFEVHEIINRLLENGLIADEASFTSSLKNFTLITNQGENISGDTALLSGYLFPDTYEISKTMSPETIIRMMTDNFKNKWTDDYQKRAEEIGMTMDDVVILASIVEREAGKDEDFPLVASVFHNRLKIGKKLESCATVQYILKERKPVLSIADTKIDSPYNTYQNEGLPPAPIASPGIKAIEAVLFPKDSEYLYFFTDKSGNNHYATSYEEHNRLISEYGL